MSARGDSCGRTGDPASCVLSRYLQSAGHPHARVTARHFQLAPDGPRAPLPRWARDLVRATDALGFVDPDSGTPWDPTPVSFSRDLCPDEVIGALTRVSAPRSHD